MSFFNNQLSKTSIDELLISFDTETLDFQFLINRPYINSEYLKIVLMISGLEDLIFQIYIELCTIVHDDRLRKIYT